MQLLETIDPVNGVYHAEIGLARLDSHFPGFTPLEKAAIDELGEPIIDCGGTFTFTNLSDASVSFTLPTNQLSFPSQFPVKALFSLADYPSDAQLRAECFITTIKAKLISARNALTAASVTKSRVNETV